jgi:hypothetical protein
MRIVEKRVDKSTGNFGDLKTGFCTGVRGFLLMTLSTWIR